MCLVRRDLYSGLVNVFSDVQGVELAIGSHVFELSLTGLNLFENYLPTMYVIAREWMQQRGSLNLVLCCGACRAEIKKWVEDEALRKKKEDSEDEAQSYCDFVLSA